jgi:predicted ferric reductase
MQEFVVVWNEESYGDTEPQIVTIADFKADGIEGDWGIDEDGDFTIEHLENLEVGDTHTVYAPYGWSIKIIKINEVK